MTREDNAKRQRIWQRKRKLRALLAFRYFMEKIGTAKGKRLIKTFLRKVARDPRSTPELVLRATELLTHIERGLLEQPLQPKDVRPVRVQVPMPDLTLAFDEGDVELESLYKQIKGPNRVELIVPTLERSADRGAGDVPSL